MNYSTVTIGSERTPRPTSPGSPDPGRYVNTHNTTTPPTPTHPQKFPRRDAHQRGTRTCPIILTLVVSVVSISTERHIFRHGLKVIPMSQSLAKNIVHIVFSTKYREPLIDEEIEYQLYKYLAGICTNLNCRPIRINGYLDHVHILCELSKVLSLSEFIRILKMESSKWVKHHLLRPTFFWQNGYGAFSVHSDNYLALISYIENQHNHHKASTFQKEFRALLNKSNIHFDERYVWD